MKRSNILYKDENKIESYLKESLDHLYLPLSNIERPISKNKKKDKKKLYRLTNKYYLEKSHLEIIDTFKRVNEIHCDYVRDLKKTMRFEDVVSSMELTGANVEIFYQNRKKTGIIIEEGKNSFKIIAIDGIKTIIKKGSIIKYEIDNDIGYLVGENIKFNRSFKKNKK